jgi:putative redox protein
MSEPMHAHASAHLISGEGYEQHIQVGKHGLIADEPPAAGGHDTGPTPFGLVLAGLAGCTGITLRMYAERHGWQIGVLRVDVRLFVEGDQRSIQRVVTFSPEVSAEQRTRLAEIAERTPVTRALRAGLPIETTIAVG